MMDSASKSNDLDMFFTVQIPQNDSNGQNIN